MGDKTITWDPENPYDCERAEDDFDALAAAGYSFVNKANILTDAFDKDLGCLVATMDPMVEDEPEPTPEEIDQEEREGKVEEWVGKEE
jgi:hypothetical protein